MNRADARAVVEAIVERERDAQVSFLAGGVAFFAFFSIVPAILLVLVLGTLVGGESFAMQFVSLVESYLSPEGTQILGSALEDSSGRLGASLVGFATLSWSMLKVFRAIDIAFDRIYQADQTTSLSRQLLNAVVVVVTIGAGVTLLVGLQLTVSRIESSVLPSLPAVGGPVMVVGLVAIFVPLYYVMPPVPVSIRQTLPGTVIAVAGLILLQQLFAVFVSVAGQYQAYGFIGVVLLFLLWLYFGALVLLVGALVNAVLATPTAAGSPERERVPVPGHGGVEDNQDERGGNRPYRRAREVTRTDEPGRHEEMTGETDDESAKPLE